MNISFNKYYRFVFLLIVMISMHTFLKAQTIKGTYAIKNVQTGMVLRIKDANSANGTPIVAYSPVNWKCVTWDFKQTSENTYQLKNLFSGKTLQPENNKATDGTAMNEQPLVNGNELQQYEFIKVAENTYLIKQKGTDLYITPADKDGAINSAIILSKKTGAPLQQWKIYEQKPEI